MSPHWTESPFAAISMIHLQVYFFAFKLFNLSKAECRCLPALKTYHYPNPKPGLVKL